MTGSGNVGLIGCGGLRPSVAVFFQNAAPRNATGSEEVHGHLYINGQIVPEQSPYAADWGIVSLRTVIDALNTLPADLTRLIVHINSPGGYVDEGFAIANTLETFKKETGLPLVTRADGQCASIATVVMLAGDEREIFENSQPFIHNPWLDPWNLPSELEAQDLEAIAKQMRQEEDRILNYYVSKTGADRDTLAALMKDQTALTADQALELKFATTILADVKAMARLTIDPKNTKHKMSKPKKTAAQAAAELKKAARKAGLLPSALNLTTTDGKKLDITTAGENPAEGDEVAIDGQPAEDGEYEIENGDKLTVEGGKISAITPADPGTGSSNEEGAAAEAAAQNAKKITTLEAANKKLTAQNADLAKRLKALEDKAKETEEETAAVLDLVEDLTKRLENTKTAFVPGGRDAGTQNRKQAQPEDRIDAALKRKEEREAERRKKEGK